MADHFRTVEGSNCLRRVSIHLGIDEEGNGQCEFVEQLGQAKNTDPVAIVSPRVVQNVRMVASGAKLGAKTLAK